MMLIKFGKNIIGYQLKRIWKNPCKPLFSQISDAEIFRSHIPKAAELKRFINQLKNKVIHDYSLPISVKELRAEYHSSPAFKDIYSYITKGHIHLFGVAARKF